MSVAVNFGHPLRARFACTRPLRVLCITTVIPAKAGIQRGRATASKAKRQVQTPFRALWSIKGEGCAQDLFAEQRGGRWCALFFSGFPRPRE